MLVSFHGNPPQGSGWYQKKEELAEEDEDKEKQDDPEYNYECQVCEEKTNLDDHLSNTTAFCNSCDRVTFHRNLDKSD